MDCGDKVDREFFLAFSKKNSNRHVKIPGKHTIQISTTITIKSKKTNKKQTQNSLSKSFIVITVTSLVIHIKTKLKLNGCVQITWKRNLLLNVG